MSRAKTLPLEDLKKIADDLGESICLLMEDAVKALESGDLKLAAEIDAQIKEEIASQEKILRMMERRTRYAITPQGKRSGKPVDKK